MEAAVGHDMGRPDDWKPFPIDMALAQKCGFVRTPTPIYPTSFDALAALDRLSPDEVRLIAAAALTMYQSPWSDRGRDLTRCVACVLSTAAPDLLTEDDRG